MAGRSVERGSSTDGTFGHKVGRIPRVHADFLFMGTASSEDNTPILVVKDDVQEAIFANVVPTKGVNDFAIGCILDDIDTMGHTEIIFKTDNAPSIVAVQEEVKGKRSHKTVLENSVRYHSRSNGLIENANGFIAGVIRTLRSFVRTMLEKELDCNHDVVAWLVKYASTLVDMFHVGRDGHTAYFRRKGKDTHPVIVQFGEKVIYKPFGKNKHNKFDERFCDGVFSGIHRRSGEYYIGTPEGIMGSRTIKSIPEDKPWNYDYVCSIKGAPWALVPGEDNVGGLRMDPEFVRDIPSRIPRSDDNVVPNIRRVRLLPNDFKTHGFTPGCRGCTALEHGSVSQNHNEASRSRMENCLRGTPQGSRRIQESEDRATCIIARQLEENERKRVRLEGPPSVNTSLPPIVPPQYGGSSASGHKRDNEGNDNGDNKKQRIATPTATVDQGTVQGDDVDMDNADGGGADKFVVR